MKKYWKTLIGTCIYQSRDGIRVYQNLIYRWLTFDDNAIQTLINRYQPRNPSLRYIKSITFALNNSHPSKLSAKKSNKPSRACLLGLGGGAIAHNIKNNIQLTVVECNPNVIQIAQRYFMLHKIKNLQIIEQNAKNFVEKCQDKYQHLIIDIYNHNNFPHDCLNSVFFYNCKRILEPDGILAINLANLTDHMPILNLLNEQFGKNKICLPIKKTENMIVYVTKNDSIKNLINLFTESNEIKKLIWDVKYGYIAKV